MTLEAKEDLKARLAALSVVKTLEKLVGSSNSQDPGFYIRPEGVTAEAVGRLPDGYNGGYVTISAENGIEIGIHYNSGIELVDSLMNRHSGIHCLIKLPDQITRGESPTSFRQQDVLESVRAAIEKTLPNEERYAMSVSGVLGGKIAYYPEAAAAESAIYLVSDIAVLAILARVSGIAKASNPYYREAACGSQAGRQNTLP